MLNIKKIFQIIPVIVLSMSSSAFAQTSGVDLFDIRIFNSLFEQSKELSYIVTLSPNEYYYTIDENNKEDPWKLVEDRVIEGKLKNGESMSIRVYGSYDPLKNNPPQTGKARLTLIDPAAARVVWQGVFNYDAVNNQITAVPDIENKKEYSPRLDITGGQHTADVDVWAADKYKLK